MSSRITDFFSIDSASIGFTPSEIAKRIRNSDGTSPDPKERAADIEILEDVEITIDRKRCTMDGKKHRRLMKSDPNASMYSKVPVDIQLQIGKAYIDEKLGVREVSF